VAETCKLLGLLPAPTERELRTVPRNTVSGNRFALHYFILLYFADTGLNQRFV
jgi:hypothetical protein